eukprot:gene12775-biopygen10680
MALFSLGHGQRTAVLHLSDSAIHQAQQQVAQITPIKAARIELIVILEKGQWPDVNDSMMKSLVLDKVSSVWKFSKDELVRNTTQHICAAKGYSKGEDFHITLELDDADLGCKLVYLQPTNHCTLADPSSYADSLAHPAAHVKFYFHASSGLVVGQMPDLKYCPVRVQGPLNIQIDLIKGFIDLIGKERHLWTACHGATLDHYNSAQVEGRTIPSTDIIMRVEGLSDSALPKYQVDLPLKQIFLDRPNSEHLPSCQTYTILIKSKRNHLQPAMEQPLPHLPHAEEQHQASSNRSVKCSRSNDDGPKDMKHQGSLVSHKDRADGLDPDLEVHEVRSGVVQDVKYNAVWVNIGAEVIGMLERTQISNERVTFKDIKKMFSVGDEIKVMVLTKDNDRQRFILSTKSLEVIPGAMLENPQMVYANAEEAAASFRAGVSDAEALKQIKVEMQAEAEARKQERMKANGVVDPNLKVHEVRSGVVQDVQFYGVWINVGAGFIGSLNITQISNERVTFKGIKKMFSVGDEVKVMVLKIDNDRQRIILSTKSLEVIPGAMLENPQLVYATAEEAAATFRTGVPDAEARKQIKAEAEARKQERINAKGVVDPNLKVHELISGVVRDVECFAVRVDIGAGVIGILQSSQISNKRVSVKDAMKMFSVGDEIKVMVLTIDNDRQRITLSTKSLEVIPGAMLENPQLVYAKAEEAAETFRAGVLEAEARKRMKTQMQARAAAHKRIKAEAEARKQERITANGVVDPNLKVHELRSGVVKSVQSFDVWVDIGAGVIGMLPLSQISHERVTPEDVKKIFSAGDDIKVHELRSGVVQSVHENRVLVDIGAGPSGLLPISQMSHKRINPKDIEKLFSVGDEIKVMVLTIDNDRQRITLSTRTLEVIPGAMSKNPQLVYATAEEAAVKYRARVLEAEAEARKQEREKAGGVLDPNLKVHELRSGFVQDVQGDVQKIFSVGDEIKVMVREIDKDRRKISLSTKSLELNPGDMVKAEEAAATFRAGVLEAEACKQERMDARGVVDPNLKVCSGCCATGCHVST